MASLNSLTTQPIYKVNHPDPFAPVDVDYISDIPTWLPDLEQFKRLDGKIEEQKDRETRESVKEHPNKDQRTLHWSEFGIKTTKIMDKIKAKVNKCPEGEPDLSNKQPAWIGYLKSTEYTEEEKRTIESAKRQRVFKEMIYLELEEILAFNPSLEKGVFARNQEKRRRNRWLIHFINEMLPDLENVSTSDKPPYLTLVEVSATLPLRRKKKVAH